MRDTEVSSDPLSPVEALRANRTRHRLHKLGTWSFVWGVALAATCVPCLSLSFYSSPAPGNMSVYSDAQAITRKQNVWADVPKFATGVYSDSGDALQISVAADVTCASPVFFRVLVDGVTVSPASVEFFKPVSATRGTRSFTFMKTGMTSGFHLVRVQWYTSRQTATIAARTLQVRSIGATDTSRLSTVVASGTVTNTGGGWLDISGLSTTVTTAGTTTLEMKISGVVGGTSGELLVRTVVDGLAASPSDVVLHSATDPARGARTATFNKFVTAGTHTITAQWWSTGSVTFADRSLSVTADEAINPEGGIAMGSNELAPEAFTSTSWVDVPSAAATLYIGSTTGGVSVAATATVEAWTSNGGRLYLRALIDGTVAADPGEVALDPHYYARTQTFVFTRKDCAIPYYHSFKLQARVDAGTTGYIRDRVLSAVAVRRTGADYVQPQPMYNEFLSPIERAAGVLMICLDPLRPGHARPTDDQVRNWFTGADGGNSVRSWYQQVSGGRITFPAVTVLGCGSPSVYYAPVAHRGTWYWDAPGRHPYQWQDALMAADADFDFHLYDSNGDNNLTQDELVVIVVVPQAGPYGTANQWSWAMVDGNPTPLNVELIDSYHTESDALRNNQIALYVHELAHHMFDAWDMYIPSYSWPTRAGEYSVMDYAGKPQHLDPYHKMRAGFVQPDLIDYNRWMTGDLTLVNVELGREVEVVYNPARGSGEYFIIENRWNGAASPYNFDSTLPAAGVGLWHIIEDPSIANASPPEGMTASEWTTNVVPHGWGRTGIRFLGLVPTMTYKKLKWSDGTHAHLRVYPNVAPAASMSVKLEKTVQKVSGTVTPGTWAHYGPFKVLAGDSMVAKLTGSAADADLYVRRSAPPTESSWDCRPYTSSSSELCSVSGEADMYVAVRGYSGTVSFTLEMNYDD